MAERVEKSWGYEEIIYNGEYCCKQLVYTRCIASSLHYHEWKHETFVIAAGEFELEQDGIIRRMVPGFFAVIPPGSNHRLRCIEPGMVVEASTHDDPSDCVRLIPSES